MSIVVNGTTLTDLKVGNTDITKVYARNGETGTYVLVFEKGAKTETRLSAPSTIAALTVSTQSKKRNMPMGSGQENDNMTWSKLFSNKIDIEY